MYMYMYLVFLESLHSSIFISTKVMIGSYPSLVVHPGISFIGRLVVLYTTNAVSESCRELTHVHIHTCYIVKVLYFLHIRFPKAYMGYVWSTSGVMVS